jgi:hypothetical protein
MSTTVLQIGAAEVRFGPMPSSGPIVPASLTDFSCQVTKAEINSSSNTTTTAVPATFCQPASEATVPVASSFTLDLDFLQDWTEAAGLSAYLFKNDATRQAFALYLKGNENPVATGEIIAQAGAFGGTPGEALVASVSLNIQGYPDIKDPAGQSLRPQANDPLNITATVFSSDPVPADLTALKADATYGDSGTSAPTDFTTGQYVILGDGSKANFKTAGKWTAGAAT